MPSSGSGWPERTSANQRRRAGVGSAFSAGLLMGLARKGEDGDPLRPLDGRRASDEAGVHPYRRAPRSNNLGPPGLASISGTARAGRGRWQTRAGLLCASCRNPGPGRRPPGSARTSPFAGRRDGRAKRRVDAAGDSSSCVCSAATAQRRSYSLVGEAWVKIACQPGSAHLTLPPPRPAPHARSSPRCRPDATTPSWYRSPARPARRAARQGRVPRNHAPER